MFFAVEFQYRIAPYPIPTLFVTAYSKSKQFERQECINTIFSVLVPILERAEKEYNAVFIANEPNRITHALEQANTEEAVVICSSMHFKNMEDIKGFLNTIKPGYK